MSWFSSFFPASIEGLVPWAAVTGAVVLLAFGRDTPAWIPPIVIVILGLAFVMEGANKDKTISELHLAMADVVTQNAVAKSALLEQAAGWKQEKDTLIAAADKRLTKEVSDARKETEKRLRGVAAGAVRVRYVAAACHAASAAVPAASAASGVGNGAGVELSAAAGQDVLHLRQAVIEDAAKIDYLQSYARSLQGASK